MDDSYKRLDKYISKAELANYLEKIIKDTGDLMKEEYSFMSLEWIYEASKKSLAEDIIVKFC